MVFFDLCSKAVIGDKKDGWAKEFHALPSPKQQQGALGYGCRSGGPGSALPHCSCRTGRPVGTPSPAREIAIPAEPQTTCEQAIISVDLLYAQV